MNSCSAYSCHIISVGCSFRIILVWFIENFEIHSPVNCFPKHVHRALSLPNMLLEKRCCGSDKFRKPYTLFLLRGILTTEYLRLRNSSVEELIFKK